MRSYELLASQGLEPGLGQACRNYYRGVNDEHSARGSRGPDCGDDVWHWLFGRGPAPTDWQRKNRLSLGQSSEIILVDHVLCSYSRGLEATGTDPSAHCFRVSFSAQGGFRYGQHSSTILQQVGSLRRQSPRQTVL